MVENRKNVSNPDYAKTLHQVLQNHGTRPGQDLHLLLQNCNNNAILEGFDQGFNRGRRVKTF
eukprot:6405222-Amphidinium_carterae.2